MRWHDGGDAINAVPATLPNAVLMKRKGIDSVISAATVNENSMISREPFLQGTTNLFGYGYFASTFMGLRTPHCEPWQLRNTRVMVMDFAKFTSTRWKGLGRYCDLGSGPIAVSRRKNFSTISPFFNSFTTPENVEKHCYNPWLRDYSLDLPETPYEPKFASFRSELINCVSERK